MNSELAQLQSLVSKQFIFIKKSLQELNDLYQHNENISTYPNVLITQIEDLQEESKTKNRIIQSLVEHNNVFFWQTKDQTVAIENKLSKIIIVSNLEKKQRTYHFSWNTECKGGTERKCSRHNKEQYS